MKILVTATEVADAPDDFEIDGTDIDRRYLEYGLNEWDDYAVEAGVRLSETHDDVEVVSATIGPERSEETVRTVLAKGVDRAIRVWDDDIADTHLDVAATTRLLAAVAEAEDPDLILTGVQASDEARGATGVSLASELGFQWAAVVNRLEVDDGFETASVHRELENGVEELTEIDLPAVFTIQLGINEPREVDADAAVPSPSIERRDLADLGLDASALASPFDRVAMDAPDDETETTYFEGDADDRAGQLADLLRGEGLIDG